MDNSDSKAMIADFLRPDRYEPQPEKVELIQTHCSWVFIAGEQVFKIKKPVNFGFLDFSTIALRHQCCREELRLNRRLAGDYYLGLQEVVRRDGGYYFGGSGELVDYAVVMKRLPEQYLMRNLLKQGGLEKYHFAELVPLLAEFYFRAEVFRNGDFGSRDKVRFDVEENFEQTAGFIRQTISPEDFALISSFSRDFLEVQGQLFRQRLLAGAIREGHGDLHMEHVCLVPGQPLVYDCIEFNQRFRRLDVVNDLAFLAMDLEMNNRFDLAAYFIDLCRQALGDLFAPELLLFYKCYRAYVRGKIASFMTVDPGLSNEELVLHRGKAERYFHLAAIYASPPPHGITLMAGVSGSGKSFLAEIMAGLWGMTVLRSDVVRKELAGLAGQSAAAPFGKGIYKPAMGAKTYRRLAQLAAARLAAGENVIIDAANLKAKDRAIFLALASEAKVPVRLLVCRAPMPIIEENLRSRQINADDASDADIDIARRQRFEAPKTTELEAMRWLEIDTRLDPLNQIYRIIDHERK